MPYFFTLLLIFSSTSFAQTTRSIDADEITSSDKTKTYSLPAATDTIIGRVSSDTMTNKTLSGSNNTFSQLPVAQDLQREVPSGLINGANAAFTLSFTPATIDSVQVLLNGILQIEGALEDYTISGTTITFTTAPAPAQTIMTIYPKY